jgi:Na+/H+ antiporter NhaA
MQTSVDDVLMGVFLFFIGLALIYKRGFSYWLRGKASKYPPNYFRVVDLTGGIILCGAGLVLIAKSIL